MITYTWSIKEMVVMPVKEGQSNVVLGVKWNILGEDQGHSYDFIGWESFTVTQGENFTPYDQLTEAQVISWVKNTIGEKQINQLEASIKESIDALMNPPVQPTTAPLPWAQ